MQIKKLELYGFKSFVDRTVVLFDRDITCVVGPNGCGKSNIVDAVRWAMGEQSPRALRGKGMEDVIFAGSEVRRGVSFAEVSITFDNSLGLCPPEYQAYAEINITRRLSRDGRSDYLINRTPVRLSDLVGLFLGTGAGRRAYSVIEQGRVGFIVSAKPEERRHLIEEAAGVTKFRTRKRAAQRKMEQTQANLLRVSDIVQEIEKSLGLLKRQAQKAERFKMYRQELRELELWQASHRWLELRTQELSLKGELDSAETDVSGMRKAAQEAEHASLSLKAGAQELGHQLERHREGLQKVINALDLHRNEMKSACSRRVDLQGTQQADSRELEHIHQQLAEHQMEVESLQATAAAEKKEVEQLQEILRGEEAQLQECQLTQERAAAERREDEANWSGCSLELAKHEASLQSVQKRDEADHVRLRGLQESQQTLEQRVVDCGEQVAALQARQEGLRSGAQQTESERQEVQESLERLREWIGESDKKVEQLREQRSDTRSRLRTLEELEQKREDLGGGTRALLSRAASEVQGMLGLLADELECDPGWNDALAAALRDRLQGVLFEEMDDALAAVEFLRAQSMGRATVLSTALAAKAYAEGTWSAEPSEGLAQVAVPLRSQVRVPHEKERLVELLLHDVWVVGSLTEAFSYLNGKRHFVTREGDSLAPDGSITGGSAGEQSAHSLELRQEIRRLGKELQQVQLDLEAAQEEHSGMRSEIASHQARLEAARSASHEGELALVQAQEGAVRLAAERGNAEQQIARAADEENVLRLAIEGHQEERARLQEALGRGKQTLEELQLQKEKSQAAQEHADQVLREQTLRVADKRVEASGAQQRLAAVEQTHRRMTHSLEELSERRGRILGDAQRKEGLEGELITRIILLQEHAMQLEADAAERETGTERARTELDAQEAKVDAAQVRQKEIAEARETAGGHVSQLQLKVQENALTMRSLCERVEQRYRVSVEHVVGDYHARELPSQVEEARVKELERLLERMGHINLTAIEEYQEQSERHVSLTAQRDDLEEGLKQLEQAIKHMNKESRRLFKEAFEAINTRFKKMFPRMFGGGKAELRLSNPEDLLETGVELIAMPPGKRLGSLELMSGGEKALTAVALILAIFRFRPSPFCIFDEVDAPLDEANVARFNEALREMTERSQFILISHSKRTMEMSDVLYGVTMETPGVSKLVSVVLDEYQGRAQQPRTQDAAVA